MQTDSFFVKLPDCMGERPRLQRVNICVHCVECILRLSELYQCVGIDGGKLVIVALQMTQESSVQRRTHQAVMCF